MTKHAYSASQWLGWRLDAGFSVGEGIRAVHFTPLGAVCSVSFGTGITPGLELVVNDIDAAWGELASRGHGGERYSTALGGRLLRIRVHTLVPR